MSWFKRDDKKTHTSDAEKTVKTEGLWQKCESCREIIWKKDLDATHQVCPRCGAHFRLDARSRLQLLFDGGEFVERDGELRSSDPLQFVAQKVYSAQLAAAEAATSMNEALISGEGTLDGRNVNIWANASHEPSNVASNRPRRSLWCPRPAERVCRKAQSASCRWLRFPRP
jgi:acetyl-CoA carboxylase carboxyl transferase subunit beta